ncbi:amino acid/polyamine transporter I [Aspergillus avenaceus]|uniref:Amino acid/polyamine transporter I n=1 Tax=Aspergillus avenaceus TaxID=36643 RepID=A0A5N6U5W9_ASPAV|nr:amino acid/polyamine transporter I [Aspergillus avenaceus]
METSSPLQRLNVPEEEALMANSDRDEEDNDPLLGRPDNVDRRHLGLWSTTFLIINRMIGTAIFSVPSSIAGSVGSAGAAISLWIVGFLLSLCGLMIWLELGCLMPRSGGEKVYLETAYPRPPMFAATIFAVHVIFLGFTGIGSVVVAENLLLVLQLTATDWAKRLMAIIVLASIAAMHIKAKTFTVKLMNLLASVKLVIMILIVFAGIRLLTDQNNPRLPHPGASYDHPFAGSSTKIYDYVTALLQVLSTYQGWSNAAYVLDEVKDPQRTLKLAGVLGLGSVGLLYILVNMAYFAGATPEELSQTGVTVVALFIGRVFGETMQGLTAVLAMLSSLGNIMTSSFAMSRVVQSLGREGILPFASFFADSTASGSPKGAFLGVFLGPIIMILLIPFGSIYTFLLSVSQYSMAIVYFAVVVGLFIIRKRMAHPHRTFRVWTSVALLFLLVQTLLVVSPFMHEEGSGTTSLPVWLMPLITVLALGGGAVYWYGWRIAMPRMMGFTWDRRESTMADGTVMVKWTRRVKDTRD